MSSKKTESTKMDIRLENIEKILKNVQVRVEGLSAELKISTHERNFNEEGLLTLQEAAKFLGISKSLLYKLTSRLLIPHFKPRGKMIYFEKKELEEWIRKGRIESAIFNMGSEKK